jgi:hypothetical protein
MNPQENKKYIERSLAKFTWKNPISYRFYDKRLSNKKRHTKLVKKIQNYRKIKEEVEACRGSGAKPRLA